MLLLKRRGRRRRGDAEDALDGRRLEQSLEHATGAPMLKTLVGSERVLGAIPSMAELAEVESVRLLVLVLKVPLERVVAAKGAPTVRALLRFVDASGSGRRHPHRPCNSSTGLWWRCGRSHSTWGQQLGRTCRLMAASFTIHNYTESCGSGKRGKNGAMDGTWDCGRRQQRLGQVLWLKELYVDIPGARLVVRVDVRH